MIEHLLDEALLVALREGRKQMNFADVMEAKFTEEIGLKQPVAYTDERSRGGSDARGGTRDRRLLPRQGAPARGPLDHQAAWIARPARPQRRGGALHAKTRSEIEAGHRDLPRRSRGRGAVLRRVRHGAGGRPHERDVARRADGRLIRDGRVLDQLRGGLPWPDLGREPRGEGPGRRARQAERGGHPQGPAGAGPRGARREP